MYAFWNLAFGYFHQNATFLTVFIRVVFSVGQIFHDMSTWLKRHITTKYQVS